MFSKEGRMTGIASLWLFDFGVSQSYPDLLKREGHQNAQAIMKRDQTRYIPPLNVQLQEQEVHVWRAS
jgi:hypothetical protein